MNKKITIGVIVGLVIFIWSIYSTSSSRAHKLLSSYLKEKYGEEFVIEYFGKRKVRNREWYEAGIVYPKSYIGTEKENDTYYWGRGFVEISGGTLDPGDSYGGVLLNESANEFYLPKLKELFGANVLPVLNIDGKYEYTDFRKEYLRIEKVILGGIYIFGRVENDEDREWYRKQIYEFVQFMKQTGTFEYVALGIIVIDDRVLSKEFQENEYLKAKLVENGEKYWEKDRRYYSEVIRRELMNKELSQKVTPIINLEDINKSSMTNSLAWSNYNILLSFGLYSSKYVESMGWNRDSRPEVYTELKNYDTLSDIKFEDE